MPSQFTPQNSASSAPSLTMSSANPSAFSTIQPAQIPMVDTPARVPFLLNPTPTQLNFQPAPLTNQTKIAPKCTPAILRRTTDSIQPVHRTVSQSRSGYEVAQIIQAPSISTASSTYPTLILSYQDSMKVCLLPESNRDAQQNTFVTNA